MQGNKSRPLCSPRWILFLLIIGVAWVTSGCGIGRAATLACLASENIAPPPNATSKKASISTAIVEQIPNYTVSFATTAPAEQIMSFYRERLAKKGWKGGESSLDMTYGPCILFSRGNAQFELEILLEKPQAEASERRTKSITIILSHSYWLDYNIFRGIHGAFSIPTGYPPWAKMLDSVF